MSEAGDKTEQATPEKLRKAREKGQVSQSRDLSAALVFCAALVLLLGQLQGIGAHLETITRACIAAATDPALTVDTVLIVAGRALSAGITSLLTIFVAIFFVGALASFLQVGPLVTVDPLTPKLERLNPIEGLRNLFFKLDPYINLLKTLLKVAVLGVLCYVVLKASVDRIVRLSDQPIAVTATVARELTITLAKQAALFFLVVGVVDLLYQRWKFANDQKMSKEEVKREYKEQEGDPHNKAARQRMHEEISQNNMLQKVREADVIVVNPTHVACAIRYDPDKDGAPRLVGKGMNNLAERIRAIAKEEDIPILRDVSLARTLYELKVDTQVPEELFEAVAEVLRWVETVAESKGQIPKWVKREEESSGGGGGGGGGG